MSRYCINCKHFSPVEYDPEHLYARCSYNHSPSLITGTLVRQGMTFCVVARGSVSEGTCGAVGNHYEEKEATNV